MSDPWQDETATVPPARSRTFSPGAIAALSTLLLVLAIAGAVVGWRLADAELRAGEVTGSPTPVATTPGPPSAPPSPSVEPSASPSESPSPPPSGLVMPPAVGLDFEQVRTQILAQGSFQVVLKFRAEGPDRTVMESSVAEGAPLVKGQQIVLQVAGEPPTFAMPSVIGSACQSAKKELLLRGLLIRGYVDRVNTGIARGTDPGPDTTVSWNQQVMIDCTTGEESPSPAP